MRWMASVDSWVLDAKARTSSATTAKPRPCSPARAASMAAFKASRLVCSAMARIMSAACWIDSASLARPVTEVLIWSTVCASFSTTIRLCCACLEPSRESWLTCRASWAVCCTWLDTWEIDVAISCMAVAAISASTRCACRACSACCTNWPFCEAWLAVRSAKSPSRQSAERMRAPSLISASCRLATAPVSSV
ncbi:hypothetical protein D9M71_282290 [compost metagenome]